MSFKNFKQGEIELDLTESRIFVLSALLENDIDSINESNIEMIAESINDKLKKAGLKLHKGKGILTYIKDFTMGAGKVFLALFKGDTKKAKDILKTVDKEDILDFLYKLDLGTLHLITGPIHTIDAWTGFDLAVNLKAKMQTAKSMFDQIKDAILNVKQKIQKAFPGKKAADMLGNLDKVEQAIV